MSENEDFDPKSLLDYDSDTTNQEEDESNHFSGEVDVSRNGLARVTAVSILSGGVLLVVLAIMALFNNTSSQQANQSDLPEEQSVEEESTDLDQQNQQLRAERDQLKAQQALQKQSDLMLDTEEEELFEESMDLDDTEDEDNEVNIEELNSLGSPPEPPSESQPSLSLPQQSPSPSPRQSPSPVSEPVPKPEPIDPFERWQALSEAGQEKGTFYEHEEDSESDLDFPSKVEPDSSLSSEPIDSANNNSEDSGRIARVKILGQQKEQESFNPPNNGMTKGESRLLQGNHQSPTHFLSSGSQPSVLLAQASPGEAGILNQNVPLVVEEPLPPTTELQIGSTVKGIVVVPMVWSPTAATPTDGRFVVELIEPMTATNGEVVFPEGTLLITEVEDFADTLGIRQSVVAVVRKNSNGQIEQEEIPSGNFLVRGEDNLPLISQGYFDPGGEIAKQDTLISTLSALGRIGQVLNEPDEEIIIDTGSDGRIITQERTSRDRPDILGAALEGFFQPLSDVLRSRSQEQIQQQLNQPQVYVVEEGTPVSVYVNSFVEVGQ